MDILYYSNYCKHSQKLLQYLVKNGLSDKLNFICIDRRMRDPQTQATVVIMDNGNRVVIPPNVQSVPTLLLVKQKYSALVGDAIYDYIKPMAQSQLAQATHNNGEPIGMGMTGGMSGSSMQSQYDNFMSAGHETQHIYAPPDDYQSGKIKGAEGDTSLVDNLKQMRDQELQRMLPPMDPGNAIGNVSVQGGGYGMQPPNFQLHV
jgi:hypothetical protein